MSGPEVLTERQDSTLLITLNRPEKRNAVNLALAEGIAASLDQLDADDDLRVGVITGAGSGFCAGMDLAAFANGERPWIGDRGFAGIVRRSSRKPLIAAVRGFAVAGGLEIALACDLIVATPDTKLGVPEVKRSIVAAGGALLRLPQRLPFGVALELALLGDPITGERAHALGLVNRLADADQVVAVAMDLATRIAENGPLAVAATKTVAYQAQGWAETEFWDLQDEIVQPVLASDDAREGARAFVERRPPVWTGR